MCSLVGSLTGCHTAPVLSHYLLLLCRPFTSPSKLVSLGGLWAGSILLFHGCILEVGTATGTSLELNEYVKTNG